MEEMQESLQWWRNFQIIYTPLAIALITTIMIFISQRKINKIERLIRQEEQAQELLDRKKSALSGTIPSKIIPGRNRVTVQFGQSMVSVDIQSLRNGMSLQPLSFIGGRNIAIKLENELILISADFRGLDGRIVATIIDNEWQINPNNYFDRNYDENALEIIDQDGITKFQIDYSDIYNIRIGGSFISGNAFCAFLPNGPTLIVGLDGKNKDDLIELSNKVKTLFSYPSEKHFGKRRKN